MAARKWNKNFIWKGYELALHGLTDGEIAQTIKVSLVTFKEWKRKYPAFSNGIKYGKKRRQRKTQVNVQEFVYGRLPKELQAYWDALESEAKDCENKALTPEAKQTLFLHAWYECDFNISDACRKIGISRTHYNWWRNNFPDFNRLCQEMVEIRKDFVEGMTMRVIREGNAAAAVRVNAALNRDRGYSEKLDINMDANVSNNDGIDIDGLNLSIECRRELINAIRQKQEEDEKAMGEENEV